jgi:septal ring factor EnvC (AmiA/AmiB activator)
MTEDNSDRIFTDAKRLSEMFAGFISAAHQWKDIASLKSEEKASRDEVCKLKNEIADLSRRRDEVKAQLRAEVSREMAQETAIHAGETRALLERLDAVKKFGLEN